jgi:hypothetical protein
MQHKAATGVHLLILRSLGIQDAVLKKISIQSSVFTRQSSVFSRRSSVVGLRGFRQSAFDSANQPADAMHSGLSYPAS